MLARDLHRKKNPKSICGITREYPGLSGKRPVFVPLNPAQSRLSSPRNPTSDRLTTGSAHRRDGMAPVWKPPSLTLAPSQAPRASQRLFLKRPTTSIWAREWTPLIRQSSFSPAKLRWRKNLSGSQAVPSGLMPDRKADVRPLLKLQATRCPMPGVPHFEISIGPTFTRQYPAIPGNTRTKVNSPCRGIAACWSAYCRVTVVIFLPRKIRQARPVSGGL